jgi:hypothetical protein
MVVIGELDPRIRALAIVDGACSEDDRDRGKPHGLPLLPTVRKGPYTAVRW